MRVLELDLEVYQGPFDLLLSLLLKEEIDIFEVPLLEIILAYQDKMAAQGAPDYWDEMTEFLLLMSLLVEVKSRLLLPGAYPELGVELTPEQARDELLARLFEYSKFKAAANRLRDMSRAHAGALMRPPSLENRRRLAPLEEIAGTGDLLKLRECLVRLLENKREPDTSHVAQIRVELQRQIHIVRSVLARRGHFSFNSVFGGEEQVVQAVSLFALLDLLTRGEIRVSQSDHFADIIVKSNLARKPA